MSKYTDMLNELLKLIGGKDNVASVTHCATRLRIRLHDEDNVPVEEIKKLPGVLGLQKNVGEIQVIIGPAVDDAYQEFMKLGGFETKAPKKTAPAHPVLGHDRLYFADCVRFCCHGHVQIHFCYLRTEPARFVHRRVGCICSAGRYWQRHHLLPAVPTGLQCFAEAGCQHGNLHCHGRYHAFTCHDRCSGSG